MLFHRVSFSKLSSFISTNPNALQIYCSNLRCVIHQISCKKYFYNNYNTSVVSNEKLASTFVSSNRSALLSTAIQNNSKILQKITLGSLQFNHVRNLILHHIGRPSPATTKKNLRYKVHYPEDGKYTITPLPVTKLGGRDPETGRIIFGKIGGGHKQKFRWVINDRVPPGSKDPLIERVMHIQYDPMRTARIALVGHDDQLRYIIASSTMKKGDLITSTRELPRIAVRPKEGDAHPIGALPFGTVICCIETLPHQGAKIMINAGTSATVGRKVDGKVLIQLDTYTQFALDPECLVTVGKVSNENHSKKIIGSAQRLRWLGIRPSSGLWQRKDGRYGYKPKRTKPVKHFEPEKPKNPVINLTIHTEGPKRRIIPSTNRVS